MAIKFFCDVCEKEVADEEVVRVWGAPGNRHFYTCHSCWEKNWRLKERKKEATR